MVPARNILVSFSHLLLCCQMAFSCSFGPDTSPNQTSRDKSQAIDRAKEKEAVTNSKEKNGPPGKDNHKQNDRFPMNRRR